MEQDGDKCHKIGGSHEFLIAKLDEFGAMGWEASGFGNVNSNHILLRRQK
jgi:hypothetical protein